MYPFCPSNIHNPTLQNITINKQIPFQHIPQHITHVDHTDLHVSDNSIQYGVRLQNSTPCELWSSKTLGHNSNGDDVRFPVASLHQTAKHRQRSSRFNHKRVGVILATFIYNKPNHIGRYYFKRECFT